MTPPSSHSFSMGQNGLAYYTARCLADVCRFSLVVGLSPGWHLAVVVGVFVRPLQCYLVVKLSHLLAAAAAHDVSADTCVEYQVALPPSQRLLRCPCTARLLTLTNQIVGCWVSATRISCWIHCAPDDVDGSANASRTWLSSATCNSQRQPAMRLVHVICLKLQAPILTLMMTVDSSSQPYEVDFAK